MRANGHSPEPQLFSTKQYEHKTLGDVLEEWREKREKSREEYKQMLRENPLTTLVFTFFTISLYALAARLGWKVGGLILTKGKR